MNPRSSCSQTASVDRNGISTAQYNAICARTMAYLCNGEVQFRVQLSDMKKWNKVLGMLRMYNLHTHIYIYRDYS